MGLAVNRVFCATSESGSLGFPLAAQIGLSLALLYQHGVGILAFTSSHLFPLIFAGPSYTISRQSFFPSQSNLGGFLQLGQIFFGHNSAVLEMGTLLLFVSFPSVHSPTRSL